MYKYDTKERQEIPFDNYFLKGIDETMGTMPTPGDCDELHHDEDTGEPVKWTDEQQDAFDEYEQIYYRFMETGQELIEAFGYIASYGIR